jgi:hypothetical protein
MRPNMFKIDYRGYVRTKEYSEAKEFNHHLMNKKGRKNPENEGVSKKPANFEDVIDLD